MKLWLTLALAAAVLALAAAGNDNKTKKKNLVQKVKRVVVRTVARRLLNRLARRVKKGEAVEDICTRKLIQGFHLPPHKLCGLFQGVLNNKIERNETRTTNLEMLEDEVADACDAIENIGANANNLTALQEELSAAQLAVEGIRQEFDPQIESLKRSYNDTRVGITLPAGTYLQECVDENWGNEAALEQCELAWHSDPVTIAAFQGGVGIGLSGAFVEPIEELERERNLVLEPALLRLQAAQDAVNAAVGEGCPSCNCEQQLSCQKLELRMQRKQRRLGRLQHRIDVGIQCFEHICHA